MEEDNNKMESSSLLEKDHRRDDDGDLLPLSVQLSALPFSDDGEDEEEEEDDEDDEEFSFACNDGALLSPVAAGEVLFRDREIGPVFPLFDRDLFLAASASASTPPVKQVFVETTTSSSGKEEVAGAFCNWSSEKNKTAGETNGVEPPAPEEGCKKSNSTGFSRFWRFKDFVHRSNSDGRDAFVLLKPPAPAKERAGGVNAKDAGKVEVKVKNPQKKKKKSESALAHERYMKSKAGDGPGRRRSYLPYRPELVGLFTNVNGGLTRNVHPF